MRYFCYLALMNKIFMIAFVITLISPLAFAEKIEGTGTGASFSTGGPGCGMSMMHPLRVFANDEKYELVSDNLTELNIFACDDKLEVSGVNMREIISLLAARYSECLEIAFNDEAKQVRINGKPRLIFVQSTHVETSSYVVENGESFSLETSNETRRRYICPYDLNGAAPWAQRAFQGKQIKP